MDFHLKKALSDDVERVRLNILTTMVTEISPGVLALQEAPPDLRRRNVLGSAYRIVEGQNGIAACFLRARWRVLEHKVAACGRALVVKVDSVDGRLRLWVWIVHLPALWIGSGDRRALVRDELRGALRAAREEDPHRYELMVGDFNMPPYDESMMWRDGLYASLDYEWVKSKTSSHEVTRRPLFNPSWQVYGRLQPPRGTFYKGGLAGGPWRVLDQALMSADLALPDEPQVRIIDRVGELDLCADSNVRAPKADRGSDHLPLEIQFRSV
jgi:endonuclease/exonuclease/phosphatase family metal-dependent hydrolase